MLTIYYHRKSKQTLAEKFEMSKCNFCHLSHTIDVINANDLCHHRNVDIIKGGYCYILKSIRLIDV